MTKSTPGERIQKVLSAAGVASRRQVETWLVQGRLSVNGEPATAGHRIGPKDVVALDGRRLRLAAGTGPQPTRVIAYHRAPGEPARAADAPAGTTPAEERLPKVHGARWLPLGAMAPSDGGLELFTTDGNLRAAVSKQAGTHDAQFAVRVRRAPTEQERLQIIATAAAAEVPFEVGECVIEAGEGSNAWLHLMTRGARARDVRAVLAALGHDVGRLLRTRFLGYAMPRLLARGRSAELDPEALITLCAQVDYRPVEGEIARAVASPRNVRGMLPSRGGRPSNKASARPAGAAGSKATAKPRKGSKEAAASAPPSSASAPKKRALLPSERPLKRFTGSRKTRR